MKKSTIILGILMVVALIGGVILVNQSQDSRRGAAFANTSLMLLPSEKIVKNIGEELLVHLNYTTEGGAKLYNVETVVCYGPQIELSSTGSSGNADLGYGSPLILDAANSGSNKCSKVIYLKESSKINLAATTGELGILKFTAKSGGSGTITIDKNNSKATGENPNSETDKWITVTTVAGTSYEITGAASECSGTKPADNCSDKKLLKIDAQCVNKVWDYNEQTCDRAGRVEVCGGTNYCCPAAGGSYTTDMSKCPSTTVAPTAEPTTRPETTGEDLKFKVTYAGVIEGTECAVDWPVKVLVMGGGSSKVFTGVKTTRTNEKVNGLVVYEGSLKLGNFGPKTGLAVFIKGAKHLQMKYGKDGQVGSYGKPGGEISVGSNYLDFTKYPMLAGDVNTDGWVNGQDFSIVKSKAVTYAEVAKGGNHPQDLDGSCQVNTRDLTLLVNSLDTKQEELY